MEEQKEILKPSTRSFVLFLSKVKQKTPLEIMRELEEKFRQRNLAANQG